ncbi:MAG: AAA family ATPase [Candidatus Midichloria sp.]|nr:AAA family ATPase [Candidatus Midichloria sp.]
MCSILGKALKDDSALAKAVLTGITRVSQESLFSGLNNVRVYSLLNERYCQYFGFTEERGS